MAVADRSTVDLGVPVSTLDSGVVVHHGVEFATVEGFRPLLLDLYLPRRLGAVPGNRLSARRGMGGRHPTTFWSSLRFVVADAADRLAQAGFVVATLDYRLSGEARFPAQLHDVKAAIRWIRGNASALGIDPARMITWGESAGGHLAMLAGLTGDRPDLEGIDRRALGPIQRGVRRHRLVRTDEPAVDRSQHPPDSDKRPDDADSWESTMVGVPLQNDPERTLRGEPDLVRARRRAPGADPPRQRRHARAVRAECRVRRCATRCRRHGRADHGRRQ